MVDELTSRQIIRLSEQGAPAEEIASTLSLELPFVKLVLSSNSQGSDVDRDINDDQLKRLRDHAFHLAVGADDEAVQARMTQFLIERDKPRERAPMNPIIAINQALIQANDSFKQMTEKFSKPEEV